MTRSAFYQDFDFPNHEQNKTVRVRMPNLIYVPEGEFWVGTSEEEIKQLQLKESDWAYDWSDNNLFRSEQPQFRASIPGFEIAQFPVTNQDYFLFVTEAGYRLPRGWVGFTYTDETDNHPVTGVSKRDAEAYIEWLNRQTGLTFRLPTELEWERAARGSDSRIYPWGNTFDPWRCNTAESMKKGTTAVGDYSPSGDSPMGVADMVGNVWEWTSSVFQPYPINLRATLKPAVAGERFVIRGGSWYYTRKLARCSAREGVQEHHQSPTIGFRLARSVQ
jgi:formylglycine-generating enzyme required for sulfatase activity